MDIDKESEIVKMHEAGMNPTSIAAEIDESVAAVRTVLKAHSPDNRIHAVPSNIEAEVVQQYSTGTPIPEILAKHGITYGRMYGILLRNEIPLRKVINGEGKKIVMETAIKMYQDGVPLWKLKEETGVAQPMLHAELHKRNIPLRRPR